MSIQNVPYTAGQTVILDPASLTLAQAPARLPADTYDLVVSLGTDYHTFDRLLRWVRAYLAENPQIRCLIQHGHTDPIAGADNVKLLPAQVLKSLYSKAQVVLVQGGPGSIQDARATGAIPLAVPRRAEFDEVVDNHQVPFAALMEKQGGAVVVESRADLFDKLSLAFGNPSLFRASQPYQADPSRAADQLAEGLRDLLAGKTRRSEGYFARLKQAVRAHTAGKQEMARINANTPSE